MPVCDVVVVGAGVVGLAHAYAAAKDGRRVTLLERSPRAVGASVRNFGMVWPIGMPVGPIRDRAVRGRNTWLDLASRADFWVSPCGSLHLAYQPDEMRVLHEFVAFATKRGADCSIIDPAEAVRRSPGAQPRGLLGAMWSPTECCIDSREAIARVPRFLADQHGVHIRFDCPVVAVRGDASGVRVRTADGETWESEIAIVCSGEDIATLYPTIYRGSGIVKCKLQMLRTAPQPAGWRMGPHLAGGLTLRHYRNFEVCPSLEMLKRRITVESPELDRWGIHVMASQNGRGELVLGDSHEYADAFDPVDRAEVESLLVRELSKILLAPDLSIAERWHGIYAKRFEDPVGRTGSWTEFIARPEPGVWLVNGVGGAGMTLSHGLAHEVWAEINGGPRVTTSPRPADLR